MTKRGFEPACIVEHAAAALLLHSWDNESSSQLAANYWVCISSFGKHKALLLLWFAISGILSLRHCECRSNMSHGYFAVKLLRMIEHYTLCQLSGRPACQLLTPSHFTAGNNMPVKLMQYTKPSSHWPQTYNSASTHILHAFSLKKVQAQEWTWQCRAFQHAANKLVCNQQASYQVALEPNNHCAR